MVKGSRIEKSIDIESYLTDLADYPDTNIKCTKHTFKHFGDTHMNVTDRERLIDMLRGQRPTYVGRQFNGLTTAFYREGGLFNRVVLDFDTKHLYVVTFYKVDSIKKPRR